MPRGAAQLRALSHHLPGVQSALYGLALSLLICVAAVAVFTTHVLLLLPVLLSILGVWAGDQEWAGSPWWPQVSWFLSTFKCPISSVFPITPLPPQAKRASVTVIHRTVCSPRGARCRQVVALGPAMCCST